MSDDRIGHSGNHTSGRSGHPVLPYQSVWMSHWMQTSCNVIAEKFNRVSSEELDYNTKEDHLSHLSETLKSVKGFGEMEIRTSKMMNDGRTMSTDIIENGGLGSSLIKHNQETGEFTQAPRMVAGDCGKAVDSTRSPSPSVPSERVNSSSSYKFLDAGTLKNPLLCMRTNSYAKDSCFARSNASQEMFLGSSSQMPFKFDLEKSEDSHLMGKDAIVFNNQPQNAKLRVCEEQGCSKDSRSTELVRQRKKDGRSKLDNFMNEVYREGNTPGLFDIPSTSDDAYATHSQEVFQKIKKCSGLQLSPDQYIDSEKTEAMKSFYDCYSLHKLQNHVRNVETMRICATVKERIPGGYPGFSQTSFFITKKTDVNLSNEYDIINTSRKKAKICGNAPSALHNVQGKRGVILEPLSSSTDSEGEGNAEHTQDPKGTITNESSAETDTMDMDVFKEKASHSGVNSAASNKAFKMVLEISHRNDALRKPESQRPHIELPDINLEVPAFPGSAGSSENSYPNSSKTQSLEMDTLVANAEQLPEPTSHICLDDFPNANADHVWVKRLKLSSPVSSAHSPKCSDMAENLSSQKMKKYACRILKSDTTSSEPTARKHYGEPSMVSDKKGSLSKKNGETILNPSKEKRELLLSEAWIQRWLHHGSRTSPKNSGTMVVSEPQSRTVALDELQKKQFPSIKAMALMGKTMRGFQPCDIKKLGSLTIWNTKPV